MKLSRFFIYTAGLGLALISFAHTGSHHQDEATLGANQCYYWAGLHESGLYQYEPDELQLLTEEIEKEGQTKDSERRRAMLLFGARLNGLEVDPETLTSWMSNLNGTDERNASEDYLIHEIVMTLGAQGLRNELQNFLNSESVQVREATFSALLFYADQSELASMREREKERVEKLKAETSRLVEMYKSDSARASELAKQLAEQSRFAPFAVGQLKDYFAYQSFDLSDEEWLRMIGKSATIDMRSTAIHRDIYSPASGGYLKDTLTNKFFLQKLDEIFDQASNRSERLALERIFRDASAESGIADNIYNTPLFYLLGFELTNEEKAYLLKKNGLSEDQLLPPGQMHLIGYELERSKEHPEIPATAPEVEEVSEVIEQATAPEPAIEEPAEVVAAKLIEEDVEQSPNRLLWLIGVIVVVGSIGFALRKKAK